MRTGPSPQELIPNSRRDDFPGRMTWREQNCSHCSVSRELLCEQRTENCASLLPALESHTRVCVANNGVGYLATGMMRIVAIHFRRPV